jgi:hypothetical protein
VPWATNCSMCVCLCRWVFGGKPEFSFSWLIPTAVHFVDVEQVAGYSMVPQAEVEEERDDLEMV